MTASEKKSKRNGIFGTILFHTLLIIAFLFMGLTSQIPPPQEEGISIIFGYMNQGSTNIEPEDNSDIPEPVQEEIEEEQSAAEEKIVTQEVEEATALYLNEKLMKVEVDGNFYTKDRYVLTYEELIEKGELV